MFQNQCALRNTLLVTMVLFAISPVAATGDILHGNALWIDRNATHNLYDIERKQGRLLQLEVAEPGILSIDVSSPSIEETEPTVMLLGENDHQRCTIIRRLGGGLALEIAQPGTYLFRLIAQDPEKSLAEVKLTTGFARGELGYEVLSAELTRFLELQLDPVGRDGEPAEDPEPEEDPEVDTVDPVGRNEEPEEEEDPDIDTVDPVGRSLWPPALLPFLRAEIAQAFLATRRGELCPRLEADDHGDTFACATPVRLDQSLHGELRDGWSFDEDIFVFSLAKVATIEITTRGDADTFGSLYDRFGHRLARDDDSGAGANLRIVKTLAPGRYYLRLEGSRRATGSYSLSVRAVD